MKTSVMNSKFCPWVILLSLVTTARFNASALEIGDPGWIKDPDRIDSAYNDDMNEFVSAGVIGGIPPRTQTNITDIYPTGDYTTTIQAAIDAVKFNGGGVILLHDGEYTLTKCLRVEGTAWNNKAQKVILRGTNRDKVVLKGTPSDDLFVNITRADYCGVENLTIKYTPDLPDPVTNDLRNIDLIYKNKTDQAYVDLYDADLVHLGYDSDNCWMDECNLLNAGNSPFRCNSGNTHCTIRNNTIDGAYNKGGGYGTIDFRGDHHLVALNRVWNLRHLALAGSLDPGAAKYIVLFQNYFYNTDVNFHNGDFGHNLVEQNMIWLSTSPKVHDWNAFATGTPTLHDPPGPRNYVYNNQAMDRFGTLQWCSGEESVYTWNIAETTTNYGDPNNATTDPDLLWLPPTGGTFYAVTDGTGEAEGTNATRGGGAVVSTNNSGYAGTGYVDYPATLGYVEFTVVNPYQSGTYTLHIRYANGNGNALTLTRTINGGGSTDMSFPATGGWSTWKKLDVDVTLNSGSNTIRLSGAASSPDSPNIDNLTFTPKYYKFRNLKTSKYIDGMARTANGAHCGQYGGSSSLNQKWMIEPIGNGLYVKLKNGATDQYIDRLDSDANGEPAGQWGGSTSYNQQWSMERSGTTYRFRNRATGMYLDGMNRTTDGEDLGLWDPSASDNQRFVREP